jgi:hypothetical protein
MRKRRERCESVAPFCRCGRNVSPLQAASALPKAMGLAIHDRIISQLHIPELREA